ncbi:MAG: HAD-IIIC family phosphatase [Bacteroidales bacterium]|nr:HAD-IIIC family phosphatase [Bacteroidales bacterium]
MFVFRNHTIEPFFPNGCSFSGYDDVSIIPENEDAYVWFYQAPIKFDNGLLAEEINAMQQKFQLVLGKVSPNKTVIAFTMDLPYLVSSTNSDFRVKNAIAKYNEMLVVAASVRSNLKVVDVSEFTRQYPASELLDWKFYFLSQMGLNPRLAKPFQEWFAKKLEQIALKRKKCLVLDLDNTLWGGILGEDGIDGIKIGGDYPGKAFLYFQEALLELSKSGIILAVCSKNNEKDVFELWEKNPFLVLKKEHFAAWRINWQDKATNIKELAEELNLGLDSFVFVDDNPTERELIRQMLPMVSVPEFPSQPYELPVFFGSLVEDYFKVYAITDEDRNKTEQYRANANRAQAQRSFTDYHDFLRSLNIQLTIEAANEFNIQRIAQMTQKTNQFNLTTKRYTDADIKAMIQQGCKVFCLAVADKFGDGGITGCMIVNGTEIETFLLSCRILGKGIEFAFLKKVLQKLKNEGQTKLKAKYIPTAKNAQVRDFYEKCGLSCVSEDKLGTKFYSADLRTMDFEIEDIYHMEIK